MGLRPLILLDREGVWILRENGCKWYIPLPKKQSPHSMRPTSSRKNRVNSQILSKVFIYYTIYTLQGTNISPPKVRFKIISFSRLVGYVWIMLVPWRVYVIYVLNNIYIFHISVQTPHHKNTPPGKHRLPHTQHDRHVCRQVCGQHFRPV